MTQPHSNGRQFEEQVLARPGNRKPTDVQFRPYVASYFAARAHLRATQSRRFSGGVGCARKCERIGN